MIKNQKSNTYEVRTYYKDWTGVRKQKTKRGFKRKCDAQEWERAFKLKENLSLDMYFEDFVDLYLNDIKSRIKYNTWLTKKHIVEKKILPYFSKKKLQEIKPSDIRQWQNTMMNYRNKQGEGYSQVYLKPIHNQLSAILNHAVNFYDLKSNAARKAGSMGKERTSILNRSYMYNQMEQLCKDILVVLGKRGQEFIDKIEENEQDPVKLALVLGVKAQEESYNELKNMLEEYPILQYRMELFSKHIFCNSKTVFEELMRHKEKLKWQIMRIYRNRNMIVHNGEHMPYLEIVLGNLHYYVDAMFDVLIEYYHMGIANNRIIFYDIEKEEILYWENLGLDEKGKKVEEKEITQENYKKLLFNEYEGNSVKNVVKQAINEIKNKKNEKEE